MLWFRRLVSSSVSMTYRPEIDGLRALAVLGVVGFHAGAGLEGGYVGVDVFFVISGFLITGIIRRGLEQSTFSMSQFWERRVRRILPAAVVMVTATLCVGYLVLLPSELEELGESAVAHAMMLANVYFWRDTGYFAAPADFKPLLHTWSLAVEEQFYLVLPLVLVLCRRASRRRLFVGVAVCAGVSLAASAYGVVKHPHATFFLLPTRAWELLTGCLLAVGPTPRSTSRRWRDEVLAWAGLLAIVSSMAMYTEKIPFPGFAALAPVLGTAAIIRATGRTPDILVGRILSIRPLTFVGLISYSLYLWHWPIIVFLRAARGPLGPGDMALALAASFVVSVASWKWVETPCRNQSMERRFVIQPRSVFVLAALALVTTGAIGGMYRLGEGMRGRFSESMREVIGDTTWSHKGVAIKLEAALDFDKLPTLGHASRLPHLDIVVWGDSHAKSFCWLIDDIAKERGLVGKAIVTPSVVPVPGVCLPYLHDIEQMRQRQQQALALLDVHRPSQLILVARWSFYTMGWHEIMGGPDRRHLLTDDFTSGRVTESPETVLTRHLVRLAEFCRDRDIRLTILSQPPEVNDLTPARTWWIAMRRGLHNNPWVTTTRAEHLQRQSSMNRVLARLDEIGTVVLDPTELFVEQGEGNGAARRVLAVLDGRSLYRDHNHLTRKGLSLIRPLVAGAILDKGRGGLGQPVDDLN